MFERILIGVDFSDSSKRALHFGNELARKCNSEQFIVHVLTYYASKQEASKPLIPGVDCISAVGTDLDEFCREEPYQRRKITVLAGENASAEILKYCREQDCQLIVAGSHGHSVIVNTLLGSTAQKLLRESALPIMIVPRKANRQDFMGFQNILITLDFSDISLKALRLGMDLAGAWGSVLHLLHVVDAKRSGEIQKRPAHEIEDYRNADSRIDQMIEQVHFDGPREITTLYGHPDEEIVKYSEEHSMDLLVMGSHGWKGLDRILVGSTAVSVIRQTRVPIFMVCEPAKVISGAKHV